MLFHVTVVSRFDLVLFSQLGLGFFICDVTHFVFHRFSNCSMQIWVGWVGVWVTVTKMFYLITGG